MNTNMTIDQITANAKVEIQYRIWGDDQWFDASSVADARNALLMGGGGWFRVNNRGDWRHWRVTREESAMFASSR